MSGQPQPNYGFYSWSRVGAATQIPSSQADDFGGTTASQSAPPRAQISVELSLSDGTTVPSPDIQLYGPPDVTGIDSRVVLSTTPPDGTDNFETNYFPAIEFSEPDLPWRYTPVSPNLSNPNTTGLRPWICLIVLQDSEYTLSGPSAKIPLAQITVTAPSGGTLPLPDLTESFYWAHVQVAGGIPPSGFSSFVQASPTLVRSRLLCPRQLEDTTHYTAFVVPVFESGREGGLGNPLSSTAGTDNAWDLSKDTSVTLPVYYQWDFTTGPGGDFETLVLQLVPRDMPNAIGTRAIDGSNPDPATNFASAGPLTLGGALASAGSTPAAPTEAAGFDGALVTYLNASLAPSTTPYVAAPVYGRWYTGSTGLSLGPGAEPVWLNTLNIHPSFRMAAGFGTEVIQQNRLSLLRSAWSQAQGIQVVNQTLRQAGLSRETMGRLYGEYLVPAGAEQALFLTSPVHGQVMNGKKTVANDVSRSPLPRGILSPSFQQVLRPLGPIRSRQQPIPAGTPGIITRLNNGQLTPTGPPSALTNATTLSTVDTIAGSAATGGGSSLPSWLSGLMGYLAPYIWLLLLLLFALGVLFLGLSVLESPLVGVAVIFFVLGFTLWGLYTRWRSTGGPGGTTGTSGPTGVPPGLTSQGVQGIPPRSGFTLVTGGAAPVTATTTGAPDSATAAAFRAAAAAVQGYVLDPLPPKRARTPLNISGISSTVIGALNPASTVPARITPRLNLPSWLNWVPQDPLQTVLVGPIFSQPMYKPLVALSSNDFLPGLGEIPANTVGLLQTNQSFVEAYMVGLNQEMYRLLLFNGYPTYQGFTYFQQFWDTSGSVPAQGPDISPILGWSPDNDLGENGANATSDTGQLVLLIYGSLLRRYPIPAKTSVFAATVSLDQSGNRVIGSSAEQWPIFMCSLPPNITLLGFNLTAAQVTAGPTSSSDLGYYFIIQQHPSGPTFGLETAQWSALAGTSPSGPNLLSSAGYIQVQTASGSSAVSTIVGWGKDASDMAAITLREPAQVAYKASALITPGGP